MTELDEVFVLKAELGLGFEGHAASGCRLPAAWDDGMGAVLLLVDMKHSCLSRPFHPLMRYEVFPRKGEAMCHAP